MSVWGASRGLRLGWPRQWRGRGCRATGAVGFSQGFCRAYGIEGLRDYTNPARQGAESALQERLDLLIEFLERGLALDHLAVDEEGRRGIDLQHFAGVLLIGGDLVEQRLSLRQASTACWL